MKRDKQVAACARCCGFIHSVPLQLEVQGLNSKSKFLFERF